MLTPEEIAQALGATEVIDTGIKPNGIMSLFAIRDWYDRRMATKPWEQKAAAERGEDYVVRIDE